MRKLFILFVAIVATTALWASNTITYTATEKLKVEDYHEINNVRTPSFNVNIISHTFSNGNGIITFDGDVIEIGGCAFDDCSSMTSINFPTTVTTIGSYAFMGCTGLTTLIIPSFVTNIGPWAFKYVTNIVYNGPASWQRNYSNNENWGAKCRDGYIDESLVYKDASKKELCGCSSQTTGDIIIPNSVKTIRNEAFYGCNGLTSVVIPNSVMAIGEEIFCGCNSLISITIPNSVTTIGYRAFSGCSGLTSVIIGNSVTTIGDYAFNGCSGLTSVTIPSSVTWIGEYVFSGCVGLTTVTIPNSINSIEDNAFYYCKNIQTVYVAKNPFDLFESIKDIIVAAFDKNKLYSERKLSYYRIPLGVEILSESPSFIKICVDLSKIDTSPYEQMAVDIQTQTYILHDGENIITISGLHPKTTYTLYFKSQSSSTWCSGNQMSITTPELTLTTLNPKVVSAGTAVVAAETNISDYETNVGFEWRKYDAPSTLPSKSGAAVVCKGMMEGRLLNLGTDSYWNVRPYYEAADGTRYYGEWITFDPSDFSYFEPTVHTYALATSPTSNSVQVRGYVMTGTEEVTEQGFEYWINSAKAPNRVSSATSEDVHRVKASGQLMTAVLENLAYSSTYTCRAYALAGGKTYYGEEVQFLTPENPTGLFDVLMNNDAQQATKFMHNGQLFILRDGNLFTATGARVK